MTLLLIVSCVLQVSAGPLDAFQANVASIRGKVEFEMKDGQIDRDAVVGGGLWSGELAGFVETPARSVFGIWESDGREEHIVVEPRSDVVAAAKASAKAGSFSSLPNGVEQISDGDVCAAHLLEGSFELSLIDGADSGWVKHHPFRFMGESLPSMVQRHFRDAEPTYERATQGGVPCEVAIYRQYVGDEWKYSLEVSYDAAIGYLPRLIREIAWTKASPYDAIVSEAYIVDARMSPGGGYVPTKWYYVGYTVEGFFADHSAYRVNSSLKPKTAMCALTSFEATKLGDLEGPIRLNRLENVKVLAATGKVRPLRDTPSTLSLSQIKTLLKSGATRSVAAVTPNIDMAELREFDPRPNGRHWVLPLIIVGFLLALAAFFVLKRRLGLLALLVLLLSSGCGRPAEPVVKLTGRFLESEFIYDARLSHVPVTLQLFNEGTLPLRLLQVSGGCSCRQVDQSALPFDLRPGGELQLDIRLSTLGNFDASSIGFNVETDQGAFNVSASMLALPDHKFAPGSITFGNLTEDDDEHIEMTYRHVSVPGQDDSEARLRFPPSLDGHIVKSFEGVTESDRRFVYRDTVYRVAVKGRSLGLHRDRIVLENKNGEELLSAPVIWNRVTYLSCVPERVTLGLRSSRVFLRCADEQVELETVASVPEGVKAVISSPRELTIRLTDDAPAIIEGVVEVETSDKAHGPLRVPVFRYSSNLETVDSN